MIPFDPATNSIFVRTLTPKIYRAVQLLAFDAGYTLAYSNNRGSLRVPNALDNNWCCITKQHYEKRKVIYTDNRPTEVAGGRTCTLEDGNLSSLLAWFQTEATP